MDFKEFSSTINNPGPPEKVTKELQALWLDANNQWHEAHELIQYLPGSKAAWVHAYLHRKEEDVANSDFWYARAGKNVPRCDFEEEWEEIVKSML